MLKVVSNYCLFPSDAVIICRIHTEFGNSSDWQAGSAENWDSGSVTEGFGRGVGVGLALVFSPATAQVTQALSSYLMFIYMASNERDIFQDFVCEFALSMNIL